MTNLHPYDGHGDDLVKTLGGFSGCATILHFWFLGNTESHVRLRSVPPGFRMLTV